MQPSATPGPPSTPAQPAGPPTSNAQVVNNIPVQSPSSQVFKPAAVQPPPPAGGDKELDNILRDVNSSVKQGEQPAVAKPKNTKPKPPGGTSAPVLAIGAACLAAAGLIAAAVMAYR